MNDLGTGEARHKADLRRYLQDARDALLWKLDGLSDYDVRRPLTPTGTNLLGLLKHLTAVELGYFCDTFGRPHGESSIDPEKDMYATADETREQIVAGYRRAWTHSDAAIDALALDTVGTVPWWPEGRNEATFHHLLVRVLSDTQRHAGHADILREGLDGAVGYREDNGSLPSRDPQEWAAYRAELEDIARRSG
ncbi:DinB family protein [Streptomyces longispororuber]|uniref:DinB family protein n=1 Tax=Streptomyces longispororuber TaxID=68230 RepID=UPI00210B38C6|nr:DinB family protein [Streptomyces longispororuber]MCQ4211203.1 DinB family protein [Streptomyces longispororuber]